MSILSATDATFYFNSITVFHSLHKVFWDTICVSGTCKKIKCLELQTISEEVKPFAAVVLILLHSMEIGILLSCNSIYYWK